MRINPNKINRPNNLRNKKYESSNLTFTSKKIKNQLEENYGYFFISEIIIENRIGRLVITFKKDQVKIQMVNKPAYIEWLNDFQ